MLKKTRKPFQANPPTSPKNKPFSKYIFLG
jgi:hypothetical protein